MSSLYTEKGKKGSTYLLEFSDANRVRQKLRLGQVSKTTAIETQRHVDVLLDCRKGCTSIPLATRNWISRVPSSLYDKLVSFGLCTAVDRPLEQFLGDYVSSLVEPAESSIKKHRRVIELLVNFFPGKTVRQITLDDALRFQSWLSTTQVLSKNTVARYCGFARQYFAAAVDRELIPRNPFAQKGIRTSVGSAQKTYVPKHRIEQVISVCETPEWKLLFALGRYLGVRVPSEIAGLRWSDIDFERRKITLRSPKTKGHGKPTRTVPIFDELLPYLQIAHDNRRSGDEFVFSTLRHHSNLGVAASRIVEDAGQEVWSEFWNSLRASCETDLMDEFGLTRACDWTGNTPKIAFKHYRLNTGESYEEKHVTRRSRTPSIKSRDFLESLLSGKPTLIPSAPPLRRRGA